LCNPIDVRTVDLLVPLAALTVLSCKASVKADVNTSANVESEAEEDPFESAAMAEPAPPPVVKHTEFFGVARRLTLAPAKRAPTCQCVAVMVGTGDEPAFQWHGEKPDVGLDAMVIAISSEGIECEHRGRGPSIAAIDRQGNDVVVVLEEFQNTRPMAMGAIIPNPGPDGTVYVRARGRTPYGRPIGEGYGKRRNLCKVGTGHQGAAITEPRP